MRCYRLTAGWVGLSVLAAPAEAQNFTVRSTADGYPIHGQTDLPSKGDPPAVVVFLPGSGNHSRDFQFARPGTGKKELVFRDLSARLNQAGLATVRYDERGVSCVGKTEPPAPDDDRCHDAASAQTITMDTNTGDVEAVQRLAAAGAGGKCVILLGHSEGFYHIGRLVDRRGIRPAGIIGIGAPTESLRSVQWSQVVDALPQAIAMSDLDHNGRVTRSEFLKNLVNTPYSGSSYEQLGWPTAFSWPVNGLTTADIQALRDALVDRNLEYRKEVLSKPPTELSTMSFNGRTIPRASYLYWHPFFEDWTPVAGMLAAYNGPIDLFYGTRDSSVNARRQVAVARQLLGKARLIATITPGVGHTLGEHSRYGPMRAERQEAIVAAARRMARGCAASQ